MPIPAAAFVLDRSKQTTLQRQIKMLVAEGVLSGRFKPRDKLPSSRHLAKNLGVSRITVTLAYTELVYDGYLVSSGRSGYFISPTPPIRTLFDTPKKSDGTPVNWDQVITRHTGVSVLHSKPLDWRKYPYRFIYGQADESLFDHHNWRQCALQALGKKEFAAISGDFFEQDDPELIRHILNTTLPRRGIIAKPTEVLITLGAQNALWLCGQVLLTPESMAAMEDPGYTGLRVAIEQIGCNIHKIGVDEHGIKYQSLPKNLDVVFATPSHQCPTNVTMPLTQRREFLAHAAAHGYLIVEDDYEFEISHDRPPVPALKSLDGDGRVIYVGSFSKSLFPGLRLGYIVAAEPLITELRLLRAAVLRHPPGLIQRSVANFLSFGHYDALIARLSREFKERRNVMLKAIDKHGLHFSASSIAGGSSIWMIAPEGCDTRILAARLRERGVLIEPGAWFFAEAEAPTNFYRLAYSSTEIGSIEPGLAIIAEVIRESGTM